MTASCTCGAAGLPPGPHEDSCDLTHRTYPPRQTEHARRAAAARARANSQALFGVDDPWVRAS